MHRYTDKSMYIAQVLKMKTQILHLKVISTVNLFTVGAA